ncbi:Non-motile and phage-resistance protein [compost metagenome]
MTSPLPHILIVDDSADNRGLLVQLLEDDYRVTEAANGAEALDSIRRERPDLVLLDLLMPVMDGFGVLERLRDADGPFMPVIVVTAATEPELRLRALELGAHELLSKPFDSQELVVRVRNMLALKAARRAIEQRAEDLEAIVEARTREILDQNRRLQEADRFKDEFLAIVSHELRTPLNFIMGFASVLDDEVQGPLTPQQHQSMGHILEGAERMLALVEALLIMGQIQAGRFTLDLAPVSLAEAIAEIVETYHGVAAQKSIRLATDLTRHLPVIEADRRRLTQALSSLVDNAIKFTPDGGEVTLSVRLDGERVIVAVADTGVGMALDEIPRAFQRFQQLDMSSTRREGGLGLGLAIAKALIEAHQGGIDVTSEPGRGTTVRFTLPLDRVGAGAKTAR